jgi:3-hydroxyisobutyrate dehydrogenase-like beta-hydroxyacid dehydrogenase
VSSTIGLLHPGEMGCAIGAQLRQVGHRVLWASMGRGPETAERAQAADLEDVGSPGSLSAQADVILSVCPPSAASDTAESVPDFHGIYIDANAIAPRTARELDARMQQQGASFVDGGIIGRPPRAAGDVRLYLSGADADRVAALFERTVVDAPVLGPSVGAASAMKMAYAAWTKATMALLIAIGEFAVSEHINVALVQEWQESIPQLPTQLAAAQASAAAKAWRWVGEMNEIATAFGDVSLPPGFHEAAATIFGRGYSG